MRQVAPLIPVSILMVVPLLAGCSRIYLPGGYDLGQGETTPLVIEGSQQRVAVSLNRSGGYNSGEQNTSTEFSWAYSDGGRRYRGLVRGFLYSGLYDVTGTGPDTDGLQYYVGTGLLLGGHLSLPIDRTDIGLGASLGALAEFGPYTRVITSQNLRHLFPLAQGYAFVNVRRNDRSSVGVKLALGLPGGGHLGIDYFDGRWGAGIGLGPGEDDLIGRLSLGISYGL